MTAQQPTRSDHELRQIVGALSPSWSPAAIDSFDFLPWGFSNQNFRFAYDSAEFALRVPGAPHGYIDRQLEWRFYQTNRRIRTVDLVAFDAASGNMISRWLDAPLLADSPPDTSALVSYLNTLHRGMPTCGRRYDPLALSREYLAAGTPHSEVLAALTERRWGPDVLGTCHNDLNPWNVIRDDAGGWITLDWEWYGLNDPLFDLVALHQGLGLELDCLAPLAVELTDQPAIGDRLTNCLTAFWVREYAWAHAELHKGNQREEIESQRSTALERLRML